MAVTAADILEKLKLYKHRGVGTEEEVYAREELMAILAGENGVELKEEGFYAPSSYIPFFWLCFSGLAISVIIAPFSAFISFLGIVLFGGSYLLFMDWRKSPLIWFYTPRLTANLVASKSTGSPFSPLIILMAHLDSAPASFAYRASQVKNFKLSTMTTVGLVIGSLLFVLWSAGGVSIPNWILWGYASLFMLIAVLASIDFILYGYTPGANDNLTGVAAVTEIACRLFRDMPEKAEVRLVITSAEEAGMLGAQHYYESHAEEFDQRPVYLLNIDTVGSGRLSYVTETGTLTKTSYYNKVGKTAHKLAENQSDFKRIQPAKHHVGDFDSVWFARAAIPSLTLAAYDEDGMMPHIHTPQDKMDAVDITIVDQAVDYGEAIVRSLLETSL